MANGWSGSALQPPSGVQFVPSILAVGVNQASTPQARLEVFAVNAADGSVWHAWQPGPTGFSGWAPLPTTAPGPNPPPPPVNSFIPQPGFLGTPTTLAVATNQTGLLEVFAIGNDGKPYHNWQG